MRWIIDVHSAGSFPANKLSNFAHYSINFDGVAITSAESFLQSLKVKDPVRQRQICAMDARPAKALSATLDWQSTGKLYWNGMVFPRGSRDYYRLLSRFYGELSESNEMFSAALLASGRCLLWHSVGRFSRKKTCLTTFEFLWQLYRVRRIVRRRAKKQIT